MTGKRSIFEEVDAPQRVAAAGGMIAAGRRGARGAIRGWLIVLFVLVVVMIAVGGLTRLTDSGLSITEWRPVTGAVPPLDAADWAVEFAKYQASPEFQLQNSAMTLEEFKVIFWWEWGHRQIGRVIGLVWALGFFWFLIRRQIPAGWTGRLLGVGALGGLQGAVGWWMVSSGLHGRMVDVASYRLATHLGLAFLILGLIAWYVLSLGRDERDLMQARRQGERRLKVLVSGLMHLAAVQILLGALVAGIDAGRGYIDWPLMGGEFLPSESFAYAPLWSNFFENPALVQFNHRMLGYLVFAFGLYVWWQARGSAREATRRIFGWLAAVLVAQVVLGIVTVMQAAAWPLAISHQLGAVALICVILAARHQTMYPRAQSLRGGAAR
jgi:cytochrome c oxidase assembly protein subunit 15